MPEYKVYAVDDEEKSAGRLVEIVEALNDEEAFAKARAVPGVTLVCWQDRRFVGVLKADGPTEIS